MRDRAVCPEISSIDTAQLLNVNDEKCTKSGTEECESYNPEILETSRDTGQVHDSKKNDFCAE